MATATEILVSHVAVILASLFVHQMELRIRPRSSTHLFRWELPSVALVYASISTVLLLGFVMVWDSRLPLDRRLQQASGIDLAQWVPMAHDTRARPLVSMLAGAMREWNTEWLIRNLIANMNAGIAVRVALPVHTLASTLVMLAGVLVQSATRHRIVHLPGSHSTIYLLRHGLQSSQMRIAAYCEP